MNQWKMEATLQDTMPHPVAWHVGVTWGAHSYVIEVDVIKMLAAIKQLITSYAEGTVVIGLEVNSIIIYDKQLVLHQ
jgi:hypothetical protein